MPPGKQHHFHPIVASLGRHMLVASETVKSLLTNGNMKNRVNAILVGIALVLAFGGVSHAMSHLVCMSIEPEALAAYYPGSAVSYKYKITLTRTGQGVLKVALSNSCLPEGVTASFSPDLVRFTGRVPEILTSTLTVTCTNFTPKTTFTFTVTGEPRREVLTAIVQFPPETPGVLSRPPVLAIDEVDFEEIKGHGTGTAGATYQIQSTADLTNPCWLAIGYSTADNDGMFAFRDAEKNDMPARFYRALVLAPAGTEIPDQESP